MYVDLQQRGVDRVGRKATPEMEGVLEATFVVHYAMHERRLCWNLSTITSGCQTAQSPNMKKK